MTNVHSAAAPAIGYYFQGLFALVVLLEHTSDDAAVSVETADDIVLETGGTKTLYQLKHKSAHPPTLTLKGADLWRTLRIWSSYVANGESTDTQFVLVTVAPIADNSSLSVLNDSKKKNREPLVEALTREATRVKALRENAPDPRNLPFSDRFEGCEAFLALRVSQRRSLVKAIRLCASSFDAVAAAHEVSKRLPTIPPALRLRITPRLIEWWDRQVLMSLTKERDAVIPKYELQEQLLRLANQYTDESLPDNYSTLTPDDWKAHLSPTVKKQIELVGGRPHQFERAARDLWRVRNQRSDWLRGSISSLTEINEHELHLVEEWLDRHKELCAKTEGCDDETCCTEGLSLLDWAHFRAPLETTPIRRKWNHPFLVRGTYQILSDNLRVGWHPKFRDLITEADESDEP